MDRYFSARENLQTLLEAEWVKYKQAIKEDKPFDEVKIIYLRIKELQIQIVNMTDEIHKLLNIGN